MGGFNIELQNRIESKKINERFLKSVYDEQNKKLEELRKEYEIAKKAIKDDDTILISCLNKTINDIDGLINDDYKKQTEYSCFDVDQIGKIIAYLISCIEDKTYYFETTAVNDNGLVYYSLIDDVKRQRWYSSYQKKGTVPIKSGTYIIPLFANKCNDNNIPVISNDSISFYDENHNRVLDTNFDYINDYIDYLIGYKIDNNITDSLMDEELLIDLTNIFIYNQKEEITLRKTKGKK